jgi:hypothetical protein
VYYWKADDALRESSHSLRQWNILAPMINKRTRPALITDSLANSLYVIGGEINSLGTIERYDIKTNKWEMLSCTTRFRGACTAARVGNNGILICGRLDGGDNSSGLDYFDMVTHRCSHMAYQLYKQLGGRDMAIATGPSSFSYDHFLLIEQSSSGVDISIVKWPLPLPPLSSDALPIDVLSGLDEAALPVLPILTKLPHISVLSAMEAIDVIIG